MKETGKKQTLMLAIAVSLLVIGCKNTDNQNTITMNTNQQLQDASGLQELFPQSICEQ